MRRLLSTWARAGRTACKVTALTPYWLARTHGEESLQQTRCAERCRCSCVRAGLEKKRQRVSGLSIAAWEHGHIMRALQGCHNAESWNRN